MKCTKIFTFSEKYFMASNWQPPSSPVGVVVISFHKPLKNRVVNVLSGFLTAFFSGFSIFFSVNGNLSIAFLTVFFHKHRPFVCLKKKCCQVNLGLWNMTPWPGILRSEHGSENQGKKRILFTTKYRYDAFVKIIRQNCITSRLIGTGNNEIKL